MRKDMIVIKKALLAAAAVLLTIHAGGASMEAYAYHAGTAGIRTALSGRAYDKDIYPDGIGQVIQGREG